MCLSCNCGDYPNSHQDTRHITLLDVVNAAAAAGIGIEDVAGNLILSLGALTGPGPDASKSEELVVCKGIGIEEDQRYSLGVAYWANRADIAKALDGHRDFSSPQDVEQAAWKYLQNGSNVGLMHAAGTEGQGRAVESYVYRGPDWAVTDAGGKDQVIKAGDWLLGVVWEPEVWPAVKAGLINGYSWQGGCKRTTPTADLLAALR